MKPRKKKKTFCIVCGKQSVLAGKCGWCDARQADWKALKQLSTPKYITLQCPYIKGNKRCTGKMSFRLSAFEQRAGVAGNGPHSYLLACRHDLQARCPKCKAWCDADELIRNNKAAIVRAAAITKGTK